MNYGMKKATDLENHLLHANENAAEGMKAVFLPLSPRSYFSK